MGLETGLTQKESWWIDSDNALGSPFGDIDDAFALHYLLKKKLPIRFISSIFGSTRETWAYQNIKKITESARYRGFLFHGAQHKGQKANEASLKLSKMKYPVRFLALG